MSCVMHGLSRQVVCMRCDGGYDGGVTSMRRVCKQCVVKVRRLLPPPFVIATQKYQINTVPTPTIA